MVYEGLRRVGDDWDADSLLLDIGDAGVKYEI